MPTTRSQSRKLGAAAAARKNGVKSEIDDQSSSPASAVKQERSATQKPSGGVKKEQEDLNNLKQENEEGKEAADSSSSSSANLKRKHPEQPTTEERQDGALKVKEEEGEGKEQQDEMENGPEKPPKRRRRASLSEVREELRKPAETVVEELESGQMYWFYRLKVETSAASSFADVARIYIVLRPEGKDHVRVLQLPAKLLPKPGTRQVRQAFVSQVAPLQEVVEALGHQTTQTPVTQRERNYYPARPVAKAVYTIAVHQHANAPSSKLHTHLAYRLVVPETPKEVQDALQIQLEASYVLIARNPNFNRIFRTQGKSAKLSKEHWETFQGIRGKETKSAPVIPVDILDNENLELVITAAKDKIDDLLDVAEDLQEQENQEIKIAMENSPDLPDSVFKELGLDPEEFHPGPLSQGEFE